MASGPVTGSRKVFLEPDVYATLEMMIPNFEGWGVAAPGPLANALLREMIKQKGFQLVTTIASEPAEVQGEGVGVEIVEQVEEEEVVAPDPAPVKKRRRSKKRTTKEA